MIAQKGNKSMNTHTHIYIYAHILLNIYIYIYINGWYLGIVEGLGVLGIVEQVVLRLGLIVIVRDANACR